MTSKSRLSIGEKKLVNKKVRTLGTIALIIEQQNRFQHNPFANYIIINKVKEMKNYEP
jgi:hypothetical protein